MAEIWIHVCLKRHMDYQQLNLFEFLFNDMLTHVVHFVSSPRWWWWFGVLHPFQQYLSHMELMEGWQWKALCNEAPYTHLTNSASSRIRTGDLIIQVGRANHSAPGCFVHTQKKGERHRRATVNVLKCQTPKFLTKCHMQTVQTQIRLLLMEQSDQGLHCMPFH